DFQPGNVCLCRDAEAAAERDRHGQHPGPAGRICTGHPGGAAADCDGAERNLEKVQSSKFKVQGSVKLKIQWAEGQKTSWGRRKNRQRPFDWLRLAEAADPL